MQGRRSSTFTRLLRHGFTDPAASERLLEAPELSAVRSDPVLLEALGATADPDQALLGLVRLAEALDPGEQRALLDTVTTAKPLRDRLLGVLGASEALGDHLARHPADWHALVTYEASDLHPGLREFEAGLATARDPDALRAAYRRCLLGIAARDVCGTSDLARTAAELADLAAATLRAALAIASAEHPQDAAACRLAVIAMGKCGGHELNYVSDVDVIFVGEPPEGAEEGRGGPAAGRHPAGRPDDGDLLGHHRRGHDLAGGPQPAARGQERPPGPYAVQPPGVLPPVGQDLGVPGAAQGPPGGRRPRARRRVRRRDPPDGLAGRRARALRHRCAADAPPGGGQHPRRAGRARTQARSRRPAGRGVRGAAAPAGARQVRPVAAQRHHPDRARRARRRRLCGTRRRRLAGRRLPLPAR